MQFFEKHETLRGDVTEEGLEIVEEDPLYGLLGKDVLVELKAGPMSVNALSKLLNRSYKNVYDDVSAVESVGLIERDERKRVCVPWHEIETTLKLAV